ncbi:AAA family ATPase [Rathayibacter sp. VKM Ac-2759]|uniref:AAA family ATPase n=1 Tax=Rathayibacter sp. VKM Ac-2759 TaxID=2609252 RepID=UPI001316452C|nr:AAA family ATPase [Rathayibacter sp. VKM Ac-2759]QHC65692.1 AAA family ATPase [Rathayibacter sp. VKM Ac-2759]
MPVHYSEDPWTRVTSARGYAADELISTLQKSIRRGDTQLALLVGREMYESSADLEEMMWARLNVISCEDVGDGSYAEPVVVNSLYQMHERLDRTFGDRWLFATHAIRFLSERTKDRTSDELANLTLHLINASEKPFEIPEYALDVHTRRGQLAGSSVDDFWGDGGGSALENELPGRTSALKDEIQRLRAAGEWKA